MNKLLLETLMMMGLAFAIGFAVAYLIEFLAFIMLLFEPGGFRKFKVGVARKRNAIRFRNKKLNYVLGNIQTDSKVEIMDHYYGVKANKKKQDNNDNDIIGHYYGKD